MTETATTAIHGKTNNKEPAPDSSEPVSSNEQPTPNEKYITYTLDVKGREFLIANAELRIDDIENHPATRILFKDPHIEWLIYFMKDRYYNVLRDETGNTIIPTVKSRYSPWKDDKQRNKKITDAFKIKSWKNGDIPLIFNVIHTAYLNHRELENFLWLPQLQVMQADGKNTDDQDDDTSEFQYAEILMRDNYFISNNADEVYIYQNGVYKLDENGDFITTSYRAMAQDNYTLSAEKSVLNQIVRENRTRPEDINPDPYIINFINGLYDLRTGELMPHTHEYISTIQIPHAYISDAKPSKVINNIIRGILQEEDIPAFKEVGGYDLTTFTNMKKNVFVIGEPDTGKSTLLEILQNIIGYNHCSIESLEKVTKDRFSTFELKDKLLNCCDDITDKTIFSTEVVKQLSGGSKHGVGEKKGKQKVKYIQTAKLLFCGNKLPPLFQEEDKAFFIRWIIFVCYTVHRDNDPNAKKINEIIDSISEEEYSAFIKECLDAFKGVLERGHFTLSKSNRDIEYKYRILSNPLGVFIDECTQPIGFEIKTVFLDTYNKWAQKNNAGTMNDRTIGKRMGGKNGLGYKDERETVTTGLKISKWMDISLTDEARKEFVFPEEKTTEEFEQELKDLKVPEIIINPSDIKVDSTTEGM